MCVFDTFNCPHSPLLSVRLSVQYTPVEKLLSSVGQPGTLEALAIAAARFGEAAKSIFKKRLSNGAHYGRPHCIARCVSARRDVLTNLFKY